MKERDPGIVFLRHGKCMCQGIRGSLRKVGGDENSPEARSSRDFLTRGTDCQERNRAMSHQFLRSRAHKPALDTPAAVRPHDDKLGFLSFDALLDLIIDIAD